MKLKAALSDKGYGFLYESCTNQQFPIMPDAHLDALSGKYAYSIWEKTDDLHTAVRFCTSWATREEAVVKLISDIKGL